MLSRQQITDRISSGDIDVNPLLPHALQPCSVDLTLERHLLFPLARISQARVDPKVDMTPAAGPVQMKDEGYSLAPGAFVLASTVEKVILSSRVAAQVHGRSSIGRLGLFVHNAGLVDPGFIGQITLELFNATDRVFRLYPGMPIGQLTFEDMDTGLGEGVRTPYDGEQYAGKYQFQTGPTASRVHRNWHPERQVWW